MTLPGKGGHGSKSVASQGARYLHTPARFSIFSL